MTTQDLQTVADGLTSIDAQLAGLPADGGLKKEIGALREYLDAVRKLTAQALRGG
jgi:hypothetical protein